MKTRLLILLAAAAALFGGCSTVVTKVADQVAEVRVALDKLLPPDFNGPIELANSNGYNVVSLKGEGVHKNDQGQWTWTVLAYERRSDVPIFSGFNWKSTGKIILGPPPK